MPGKPRREGVLLIDHRDSPGITPGQARAAGREVPVVAGGALYESATVTCLHCNAVVVLNPKRTRPRHYCWHCDGYICDGCEAAKATLGCRPLEKLFDFVQDENARLTDAGLPVAGLPDLTPLWSKISLPVAVGPGTSLVIPGEAPNAG
jgi:hypothetical protein